MNAYQYVLENQLMELFPAEIINDPYVVYHGTSNYYSENIQNNGFERGYSPFNEGTVANLASVLEDEKFKSFDISNIANSLRHYLANNMRLSFSCLSGAAIRFATGDSKGGQIIGKIRKAKEVVENAIASNPDLASVIDTSINKLFVLCENIINEEGVIYAIRLPAELPGISDQNYVIYSDYSIPVDCVIGKVVLPETGENIDELEVQKSLRNKSHNGIGKIIFRKSEE